MMKKHLFAAALACAIAFCGFALSAEDSTTHSLTATMSVSLKNNLTTAAPEAKPVFGYRKQSGGFYSLNSILSSAIPSGDSISISLDGFADEDGIQFGYASDDAGSGFTHANVKVSSDPLFSYNYNPESFYALDFTNTAFDGNIEILNFGAPLPTSTVTLLIALSAAAGLLLYNNRRQRSRCSGQA